jgi:hypothetical protein
MHSLEIADKKAPKRVLRHRPETQIPKEMNAPDDPMAGHVLAAGHSGAHAADPSVQP